MMAFVPCWLATQTGIVRSHHTKANTGPPTADAAEAYNKRRPEMETVTINP